MAKSKKALKALKRRKEAQKRSRFVKERQDYRAGGRVKAFQGLGDFDIGFDPSKIPADLYTPPANTTNTPPTATSNTPPEETFTPPEDKPPEETFTPPEDTPPEETSPNFGVSSGGYKYTSADYSNFINSGGIDSNNNNQIDPAEREAHKALLAQPPAEDPTSDSTTTDLGTTDTTTTQPTTRPPADAESPFNFDMDVPEGTEIRNIRVNDGTGNKRVPVPWGSLQEEERQALIAIYQQYPNVEDETLRARAAYDYLQSRYGLLPEPEVYEFDELENNALRTNFKDRNEWLAEAPNGSYVFDYYNYIPGTGFNTFLVKKPDGSAEQVIGLAAAQRASGATTSFTGGVIEQPEEEEEETVEEETPEEETPSPEDPDKPPYVEEREITYYEADAQQPDFLKDGYINVEALNFSPLEEEILNLNFSRWEEKNPMPDMYVRATGEAIDAGIGGEAEEDFADSGQTGQKVNPAWTNWVDARRDYHNRTVRRILALPREGGNPDDPGYGNILPAAQTDRQFRFGTQVGYKIPGLVADDPKRADVEELAELADADTFQIDRYERDVNGNIVFDSAGNPVLKLQRAVAPGTIDPEALTTTDATLTSATLAKTAEVAKSLDISAPTVEAYTAAASNYFLKYPEAQAAVEAGKYDDFLDYHNEVGKEKGNILGFDTTKFATKDIATLSKSKAVGAIAIPTVAAARATADEEKAIATTTEFKEDLRSVVEPATGEVVTLAATANAEKQSRKAITDEEAAQGTEAIIQGSVGYEAAQRRQVTGEAAKGAARTLLQEVGELPADISEAILDNPAVVTAQVDTQPIQVQAAIAALPNEALVSVQLENLLAGIDEGVTPTWARPAVRLVESNLAARGLSVSTVGRDALFNSIIQSAIPLAQSNATALQQRAAQNLSNEQQANLQRSSQEMQLRLTNVANRQSAESQSAQLAQQINLTQKQFTQQAELTEAEQRQQVRIASLQNEQQAEMANLGNDQQIELANLQVEAERLGANQTASNQERMAEMQVAASFLQKNAEFKQQMEVANLSSDQQMRLAFLTAKNQAEAQNLTAAQQTELANLSKRLEVNKTNASLAQQMGLAQLTVNQQAAMQNAATVANIDLTKFNVEQQVELANSKFMQTSTLQDLNNRQQTILQDATTLASMNLQVADNATKVSIENARNFLAMDMANLNNEQQAYMLNSQQNQQRLLSDLSIQNAARQFNATSDLQTQQFVTTIGSQLTQFNSQQANAMAQFNESEANRIAAIAAGNELAADQFNAQIQAQISQFNSQQDLQVEQFNTANSQAVEQSNVEWRRKANLADTAATNAANQQQAAFQFDLNKTSLSQAWQSLRDQANFDFQEWQSEKERKISAINALLANEAFMTESKYDDRRASFFALLDQFSVSITALQDSDDFILPGDLYEGAEDDEET